MLCFTFQLMVLQGWCLYVKCNCNKIYTVVFIEYFTIQNRLVIILIKSVMLLWYTLIHTVYIHEYYALKRNLKYNYFYNFFHALFIYIPTWLIIIVNCSQMRYPTWYHQVVYSINIEKDSTMPCVEMYVFGICYSQTKVENS